MEHPYDPTPAFDGLGMPNFVHDIALLGRLADEAAARCPHVDPTALEIGSWGGRTALTIADAGFTVYCVDDWSRDEIWDVFRRNCQHHLSTGRVVALKGYSLERVVGWTRPLDFLYVDGDHAYGSVVGDLNAWVPHVRPGGTVAGHDVRWPPVLQAARDVLGEVRFAHEAGDDPNRHHWPPAEVDSWGGIFWQVRGEKS